MKWFYALLFLLIAFCSETSLADNFYVDAINGSDETGNGSKSNPWRGIRFAFESIEGSTENPHTIYLAPGRYGEQKNGITAVNSDRYESVSGLDRDQVELLNILIYHEGDVMVSNLTLRGAGVKYGANNVFQNCIFRGGITGSLVVRNNGSTDVRNCVFNEAAKMHCMDAGNIAMKNSIYSGNYGDIEVDGSSTVTIEYSYIEDGWPGTGNISGSDPGFVNPETFDYRLRADSPCVDVGDPADPVPPSGGSRIDMGCCEYPHKPQFFVESISFNELVGDGDGVPEVGETIQPLITLSNYGVNSTGLVNTFVLDHPDVSMNEPLVNAGDFPFNTCRSIDGPIFELTGQSGWCIPVTLVGNWTDAGYDGVFELPMSIHGTTVHVDPDGNDETGDGSPAMPYKTLATARDRCRGSRLQTVSIYAREGRYSESGNGETWPFYTDNYEHLTGDGRTTILSSEIYRDSAFILCSLTTNLNNIYLECIPENYTLAVEYNHARNVEISNIFSSLEWESTGAYINIEGSTQIIAQNCEMDGLDFDNCLPGDDIVVENSVFNFGSSECATEWNNNYFHDWFAVYQHDDLPGNVVRNNTLNGFVELHNLVDFHDNLCGSAVYIYTDSAYTIYRNVVQEVGFGIWESEQCVDVINCSVLKTGVANSRAFYSDGGSGFNCYNSFSIPLIFYPDSYNPFDTFMSSFTIDGCAALLGREGIDHYACTSTNNAVIYYNQNDNSTCANTTYSDLVNCSLPTNLDVDPGFVGISTITAIGPSWFADDTAAWEPDRYAGYYVNPNVYENDELFYCIGNSEDTIFVMGDPSTVADTDDLFVVPDLRLRSVSDGFAFDSPLIDAGDPSETDPDGTRRDIGSYGGSYALTPMPVIPTFPPPEPTATPSPSPTTAPTDTPVPSPTPTPTNAPTKTPRPTGVTIMMPSSIYQPGDICWCAASVYNAAGETLADYPLFVILDVHGTLFYAPSFSQEVDLWNGPWIPGETLQEILMPFLWPETGTSDSGIVWYAALTTPDFSEIYGEWDSFEFGWE